MHVIVMMRSTEAVRQTQRRRKVVRETDGRPDGATDVTHYCICIARMMNEASACKPGLSSAELLRGVTRGGQLLRGEGAQNSLAKNIVTMANEHRSEYDKVC